MCTDFTDLDKCYPKDDFPLTRIDQIIDSVVGCEMKASLDCFSGYHQISLCKEDEKKTSFITCFGTYYYLRMPEGLWNAGPMFYRTVKAALKDQVGRNVLSYIDDIVVASKKDTNICSLAETFTNMHDVPAHAQPRKMYIWDYKGQGYRLFSLNERHRNKPQ
jgi:hypothetical protein